VYIYIYIYIIFSCTVATSAQEALVIASTYIHIYEQGEE